MAVPDNGPVIVGVTWWLCFFCGTFLALRIYAKLSRRMGLWWDDHILIGAWVLLLAESIITQMGQNLGFGKHTADIAPQHLATIALYTSIGASISCFASTLSKISFGVTLLRLTEGYWRWFVWFCVITLFTVMIPSSLSTWVECSPPEKAWNSMVEGHCRDPSITVRYGIFNAAWCAWVDFALALLPWKLIWNLQLRTREKIGVGIAMSLGVLSGICAIVKGVYVIQLRQQDFYYNGVDVTIWTAVETATAIIAASMPVLRVFFKEAVSSYYSRPSDVPLSRVNKSNNVRSGNRVSINAIHGDKQGAWTSLGPQADNASDTSISRDGAQTRENAGKNGILQTNTVAVDFDGRSDIESQKERERAEGFDFEMKERKV